MSFLTEQVLGYVQDVITQFCAGLDGVDLLDIGCWDGQATSRYAIAASAKRVYGIEFFEGPARSAKERGIEVLRADLEEGKLALRDCSIDLAIANQVFEHIKDIYSLISEIHRVLRPGGSLVFSVPNLSSFHNRIMMLLGMQPTSIRIIGPHVRGFCFRQTIKFVTWGNLFTLEKGVGCGFYPFPIIIGKYLGRFLPSMSHTFVLFLKKTANKSNNWRDIVKAREFQTVFSRD